MDWEVVHVSDVKGWRTSVKVRPPGFSLTFRTFCLIAALTGPTIFSEREAPSVLRKRVTYVLKDARKVADFS